MVDSMTPKQRSRTMSRIRGKDTKPEMLVRRMLFAAGYRYRLHAKDLPGTPDVVFRGRRRAVFVNGCFWHSHHCPGGTRKPGTNAEFWEAKRARTIERDREAIARLADLGWTSITVWECELRDPGAVARTLADALGPPLSSPSGQ
ncbi:very short patch repair endonuclease [Specibacter sp. NPDC057265]|uniref:very short patch repair endonuclease n=1 Tax=Specibacter sp. NPDC057265 TaxID=3346075 RepID=UPI00363C1E9B